MLNNINIKKFFKKNNWLSFQRFSSYVLIGTSGFLLQLFINKILLRLNSFDFNKSLLIAIFCGATSNFFFFNLITFKDKRLTGINFFKGLFKFYFISSLSLMINYFSSLFIFNIFTLNVFISQLIGIIFAFIFNYLVLSKIIWSPK